MESEEANVAVKLSGEGNPTIYFRWRRHGSKGGLYINAMVGRSVGRRLILAGLQRCF